MSHFSVLVITPTRPSDGELARILQPWHEFECTGTDDQYVVDVDKTAEMVKVIDRPNPNAKWDWWQVGGRYTGKFAPNYDPDQDPANIRTCWLCNGTGRRTDALGVMERARNPSYGCNGCNGTGKEAVWPTERRKIDSDQIQVKDIPIDALRTEKEVAAAKLYDAFHRIAAGRPIPIWDEIRERHVGDVDAARKEYNENPVVVDLKKSDEFKHYWSIDEKSFVCTRDEYLARARSQAITAFAVVKDGQWYERGKMGWWACVSDEKDEDVWQRELDSLLAGLPPESWITVVDCHI